MTDGPFKNLQLSRPWKQFFMASFNDAVESSELKDRANRGIITDIINKQYKGLIKNLNKLINGTQPYLDPIPLIDALFDCHPKTPLIDRLQNSLLFNLNNGEPIAMAFSNAISELIDFNIKVSHDSLIEKCIIIFHSNKITERKFLKTMDRINKTLDLDAAQRQEICNAFVNGDASAFPALKKDGLDEGPLL